VSRTLSTAEAARILGLSEARVRELARGGLAGRSGRGHRYAISFQDLVVLRAARRLLDQRVPPARVRRALAALARELPPHQPLSGLRLVAHGREVAVWDGERTWQPETGQVVLDFGDESLAREVERIRQAPGPAPQAGALQARLDFERGLDLEDEDPQAAAAAYARALEGDPDLVDAYVNLGRLRHEAGDADGAAQLYQEALERSPDDPIVHFNLALALEDTKGSEAAAAHYERALALDPDFADAHYNLAGLCERLGRAADALRHYRAYQKLTGG
jgi:tetratricopeptide (TPR) repeat protein